MKKYYYTTAAIIIAALLFFSSCKKETTIVSGVPAKTYLVKTYDYGTGIRTNIYDILDRLIHVGRSDGSSADVTYSNSKVEYQNYNTNGTPAQKDISNLEASGLMMTSTNSSNQPLLCTYAYNSDRQVISQINAHNGVVKTKRYYTYSNGNRITDSVVSGNSWWVSRFEYYTDIVSTLENENWGESYLGKGNRNALKKEVYLSGDGTTWTKDYEKPVLDDLFRIVKISYSVNGAAPVVYRYTYY